MKYRNDLTAEYVRSILDYNSETGVITWKVRKAQCIMKGDIAGSKDKKGYICIKINNKLYKAHRLAYLIMIGEWPEDQIDHNNENKSDNTWGNLRRATNSQNQRNISKPRRDNKSGHRGISWFKRLRKYHAQIQVEKQKIHLGFYEKVEDAIKARKKAEIRYFGDFVSQDEIKNENKD